jgi:serine/threonine-protein phosphatase 2A activator
VNIENKVLSTPVLPPHRSLNQVVVYLETLEKLVDSHPPVKVNQRFGNPAYKEWHKHICEMARNIIKDILGLEDLKKNDSDKEECHFHSDVIALEPYFTDSFGNATRIDYGTGHELAFIGFLTCIAQYYYQQYTSNDYTYIGLKLFPRYLQLVRTLQAKYQMEPAGIEYDIFFFFLFLNSIFYLGTHGVWGLDDYQFIPFLWGAAQLLGMYYLLLFFCFNSFL